MQAVRTEANDRLEAALEAVCAAALGGTPAAHMHGLADEVAEARKALVDALGYEPTEFLARVSVQ